MTIITVRAILIAISAVLLQFYIHPLAGLALTIIAFVALIKIDKNIYSHDPATQWFNACIPALAIRGFIFFILTQSPMFLLTALIGAYFSYRYKLY